MPKVIELRQDRALIRPNFDGYKLSLESIPILRQELESSPYKAEPNGEQYSFLHVELFSMQNLLQSDPWSRTNAYFVNCMGQVVRTGYDAQTGRPQSLQVVHRINESSSGRRRAKGDYNYSMRFISEKFSILCDGIQDLYLLDTGDRLKAAEWKVVAKVNISSKMDKEIENFILDDCRLDVIQEQKEISIILGRVQRVESSGESCSHFMHLYWTKWVCKEEWIFSVVDILESAGSLYYCAFEPRAQSLIISSNHEYKFHSQVESVMPETTDHTTSKPQLCHEAPEENNFTWSQSDDDVIIKFSSKPVGNTAYNVTQTSQKITVKEGDETVLENILFGKVDNDLTTWTTENDFLEITLFKETASTYWPSLFVDGTGPKECSVNGSERCIPDEQKPIANLEAPIEDCDFPIGTTDAEFKIDRLNLPLKKITHTVFLGPTPPLFSTSLRAGFPLALGLRQDVDASLWLQQYNPAKPDEWSLRHEGNLHAFGYVQASKQQKKFIDCSPDLSYAVICESHRHVFIYKASYDGANGLRNRNGPQVTIGKQHLVALEDAGEILGIATDEAVITLLTERAILYLQIN